MGPQKGPKWVPNKKWVPRWDPNGPQTKMSPNSPGTNNWARTAQGPTIGPERPRVQQLGPNGPGPNNWARMAQGPTIGVVRLLGCSGLAIGSCQYKVVNRVNRVTLQKTCSWSLLSYLGLKTGFILPQEFPNQVSSFILVYARLYDRPISYLVSYLAS